MGSPITSPAKPTAHTRDGSGNATGVGENNAVAGADGGKDLSVETANARGAVKADEPPKVTKTAVAKQPAHVVRKATAADAATKSNANGVRIKRATTANATTANALQEAGVGTDASAELNLKDEFTKHSSYDPAIRAVAYEMCKANRREAGESEDRVDACTGSDAEKADVAACLWRAQRDQEEEELATIQAEIKVFSDKYKAEHGSRPHGSAKKPIAKQLKRQKQLKEAMGIATPRKATPGDGAKAARKSSDGGGGSSSRTTRPSPLSRGESTSSSGRSDAAAAVAATSASSSSSSAAVESAVPPPAPSAVPEALHDPKAKLNFDLGDSTEGSAVANPGRAPDANVPEQAVGIVTAAVGVKDLNLDTLLYVYTILFCFDPFFPSPHLLPSFFLYRRRPHTPPLFFGIPRSFLTRLTRVFVFWFCCTPPFTTD